MRRFKTAPVLVGLALAALQAVPAQTPACKPVEPETTRTIFLKNALQQNDLNDLQTDLRNMVPHARIYGVMTQSAITLRGTAEDLQTAQNLVNELDRPRSFYRLTFTIIDNGKPAAAQHYVLVATLGQRATLKRGSRVPIATEVKGSEGKQVEYQDLGVGIEATLTGSADGLTLHAKVEQTGLDEEKPPTADRLPVIHQAVLDGVSELTPGKPLVFGSLDAPANEQRQEIEVVAEPVH